MKKTTFTIAIVPLVVLLGAGFAYQRWGGPASVSAKETKTCTDNCDAEKEAAHDHEAHESENSKGHAEEGGKDVHAEEGGHAGHGHGEEKLVVLTEAQQKKFGVQVRPAGPGKLQIHLTLAGEVTVNADRVAHVVPRVAGVVREVRKNLGDFVKKGEVLAVLDSRELADTKAGYLAARERLTLAKANFDREEQLWKKKISAEQEYLQARQGLAEANIELRSAEQKLHALGLSEASIADLPRQTHLNFTRYELTAPFDSTVTEKHMTLGEAVKDDAEVFTLADLSSVWVTFNLHQKDLAMVQKDQSVRILASHGMPEVHGKIAYIAPIIGEQTRTTPVRVVLENPRGEWRPGLFVTGQVLVESAEVPVLVASDSVLMIDGKPSVFIKTAEGFEPQPVTVGRTNETSSEIISGLSAGQPYVSQGAYTLKLELGKFKGDPCGGH